MSKKPIGRLFARDGGLRIERRVVCAIAFSGAVFFCLVSGSAAQMVASAPEYVTATTERKREVLVAIIRHTSNLPAEETIEIVRAGLRDPDPVFREVALAAVVSRSLPPRPAGDVPGQAMWGSERPYLQQLRDEVLTAIRDPAELVRAQAVSALASLDFDSATPGRLTPASERILVDRFYVEPSGRVRSLIVSGFASEPEASLPVRQLITDAFRDSFAAVRHAAVTGAPQLEPNEGMQLLAAALEDADAQVCIQAGITLSRFGTKAAPYRSQLERALTRATDPNAQAALRAALRAITPPVP